MESTSTANTMVPSSQTVAPPPPPTNPFAELGLIEQQFFALVNHLVAAGARATTDAGTGKLTHIAPIFYQSPHNLPQTDAQLAYQQDDAKEYYEALEWCTDKGYLVTDDSLRSIPVDPLCAQAYTAVGDRFAMKSSHAFGEFKSSAVSMIMRTSAFHNFTQEVDRYAQARSALPDLNAAAVLRRYAIHRTQPRLLVMGPQGMGKSYSMLYDVTLKRSIDTNRVIFIPDCGQWVSNSGGPLVYLIECILIAFHADPPVIAACHQVGFATRRDQSAESSQEMVTNLLAFLAMYCQLHRLRLYLYADQLNELMKENDDGTVINRSAEFPFSILRFTDISYWPAFGAAVITAASANNGTFNQVSPSQRECKDMIFSVQRCGHSLHHAHV